MIVVIAIITIITAIIGTLKFLIITRVLPTVLINCINRVQLISLVYEDSLNQLRLFLRSVGSQRYDALINSDAIARNHTERILRGHQKSRLRRQLRMRQRA